jgi:nucleoside-diphosphate-sugar epimerase
VHVFRPFSGYGSDQSSDYPFGAFIDRALSRQDPFEVWGDGEQVRDWIHVDDIVRAVFAGIDQDFRGPVNLCTGRPMSFNELARIVTEAAGYEPAIKHLPAAPQGVRYRVGDSALMRTIYQPTVSLEEGVQRALKERR